eukprot:1815910-Rhodomonas_salina.1
MGRWLLSSSGGAFLVIKVTSTSFQDLGNAPVVKAWLITERMRLRTGLGRSRRTSFGMPSGPGAFRRGRVPGTLLWPEKTSGGRKSRAVGRGGDAIEQGLRQSLQYHSSDRSPSITRDTQMRLRCPDMWLEQRGRAPRALDPK